mmetsp:Transcript_19262/g.53543  ORF Transcript_19262/g.53543 Transcript_19262/m.53543 type:complete len:207 (-) Transcript_19262:36-656(-)
MRRQFIKDVGRRWSQSQHRPTPGRDLRATRILHEIQRHVARGGLGGDEFELVLRGTLEGDLGASRHLPGTQTLGTLPCGTLVASHGGMAALRGDLALAHRQLLVDAEDHLVRGIRVSPVAGWPVLRDAFRVAVAAVAAIIVAIAVVRLLWRGWSRLFRQQHDEGGHQGTRHKIHPWLLRGGHRGRIVWYGVVSRVWWGRGSSDLGG